MEVKISPEVQNTMGRANGLANSLGDSEIGEVALVGALFVEGNTFASEFCREHGINEKKFLKGLMGMHSGTFRPKSAEEFEVLPSGAFLKECVDVSMSAAGYQGRKVIGEGDLLWASVFNASGDLEELFDKHGIRAEDIEVALESKPEAVQRMPVLSDANNAKLNAAAVVLGRVKQNSSEEVFAAVLSDFLKKVWDASTSGVNDDLDMEPERGRSRQIEEQPRPGFEKPDPDQSQNWTRQQMEEIARQMLMELARKGEGEIAKGKKRKSSLPRPFYKSPCKSREEKSKDEIGGREMEF